VPGTAALTGSSQVTKLKYNATTVTTSAPQTISLLGATLYINRQIVSGNEIIQRAFEIDSAFGPDIVVGESRAGFVGTPVHPAGSPCSA
jgi:hypothetical protein